MNNKTTITIIKDGKEISCDIYFTFISEETNKGYVAYTDHSLNENGEENIYMASYNPDIGIDELKDVTDEKEIDMFNEVINKVKQSA